MSFDAWLCHHRIVDYIRQNGEIIIGNPYSALWSYRYYDVSDKSFRTSAGYVIDTTYSFDMRWFGTYRVTTFKVHLNYAIGWQPIYGGANISAFNHVADGVTVIRNNSSSEYVSHADIIPWDPPAMGPGVVTTNLVVSKYTPYTPLFTDVAQVGSGYVPNFITYRKYDKNYINRRHTAIRDAVEQRLPDIRPSAFLAAADALNKNIQVLSSNNLQNLQHLKDILSLLPDLPKLARLVAKAASGDPSVIVDIIDFITEEILKLKFQREPLSRDLSELARKDIKADLEKVLRSKHATIYGEFNYTFSDSENFCHDGVLKLETRAKVRIHSDPSTLLTAILTANSIGLLPSLSRIWSLLPFSFVVDWFTNESKRLKLVDTQVLYMTFRISQCLYSYKVVYYPSPDELSRWGLESYDSGDPFGISVYQRELSRYAPRLSDSKFDFLRVTRGPDPLTVGSLVWQLLS
jgi:hypothetical protein